MLTLTQFFLRQGIETEQDLAAWLAGDANVPKLLDVRGVGPKTANYLKIRVGLQTAAADRYVFRLLQEAGVATAKYDEVREVLNLAADAMGVGGEPASTTAFGATCPSEAGSCRGPTRIHTLPNIHGSATDAS